MVELEIHAYNALQALSEGRKLGYNDWRKATNTNIQTMNKVRRLLFQQKLIIEEPFGKQGKLYSINETIAKNQEELVNHMLIPYSKITENFIKSTKNIQQKLKSHQRVLAFSEKDSKIAKELWLQQKTYVDIITDSIEQERNIRLVLLSPVLKLPYKKKLEQVQKRFYESVEKYFNSLYQIEPVICMELWQIIFFKISKQKPQTIN